jgi:hypothetical protein
MAFYWGLSDAESDRADDQLRDQLQREVLRTYGLKPWDVGLVPVPRRVRAWRKACGWLRVRTTDTATCENRHT